MDKYIKKNSTHSIIIASIPRASLFNIIYEKNEIHTSGTKQTAFTGWIK